MRKAKVDSKKIRKAAKPRRAGGVQVRSGVKAGRHRGELGREGFGSERH